MAKRKLDRETITQAAAAWAAGLTSSGTAISDGVNNPRASPTAQAIAQKNVMVAAWNASITNGTWAQNLQASGDAGWKAGMINKTIPNLATSASAGQPHYLAFAQQWFPALEAQVANLPARGDYAANKARANSMMDWEHSQRGKYRKLWRG